MLVLSGPGFSEAMKKNEKLAINPVSILSTYANKVTIEKITQAGALGFITKPPGLTEWLSN